MRRKDALLAADVQGFIRIVDPDGTLAYQPWPEKEQVLSQIDILKTDAVEAEMLTGLADIKAAARAIAAWGPREIVLTHRDGVLVFAGKSVLRGALSVREKWSGAAGGEIPA